MTNLIIELSTIQNRIVDLYKSKYNHKSKESAIIDIIEKAGEEFETEDLTRDWKEDPATEKQIYFLNKLGIKLKKGITKFEASKIIEENKKKESKEEDY